MQTTLEEHKDRGSWLNSSSGSSLRNHSRGQLVGTDHHVSSNLFLKVKIAISTHYRYDQILVGRREELDNI